MKIEVFFVHQTEHAVLVNRDGGEEGAWLPKSQIEIYGDDDSREPTKGEQITLIAPEWLLKRAFLIPAAK